MGSGGREHGDERRLASDERACARRRDRERRHRPARADRAFSRADRGGGRRSHDLPAPHRRARPCRGRGRPPARPDRPQAIAARRRADLVEGPLRQRRRRHQPRHAGVGGAYRRARRDRSGPRHPRRAGLPRQDQPDRVRLLHPRPEPQDGHPAQPLRRNGSAFARRVVLGRRRLPLRAASPLRRSVRTRAAPCACRPPGTAWSA